MLDELRDKIPEMHDAVMETYKTELAKIFSLSLKSEEVTAPEIMILIMNIIVNVTGSMYFSLKYLFPDQNLDFNFLKASLCNAIADKFEYVKNLDLDKVSDARLESNITIDSSSLGKSIQ